MKTSLDHLPQNKQSELQDIVTTIRDNCDAAEMVILYGSYARGDYKEAKDLEPNRKSGHVSDYDILVVTTTKEVALDLMLWRKIEGLCRDRNISADPRIITHDIHTLNSKLSEGQYFYTGIKTYCIPMYNSGNFELAEMRDLTSEEQKAIAQENFDKGFKNAKEFLDYTYLGIERDTLNKAAFFLHQATEHAYKTIISVFDNDIPHEHRLEILENYAARCNKACKDIIPRNDNLEQRRFEMLDDAYIDGRYNPDFLVRKRDLEPLLPHIEKLLKITEQICKAKIASFTNTK